MKIVEFYLEIIVAYIRRLSKKKYFWSSIFGAILIVFILPLLFAGFYNHPSADDYSFGLDSFHAIQGKTGFEKITAFVGAAVSKTITMYDEWGGYYTSTFLSALRPSILGEEFSFLHPFIMIGTLSVGVIIAVNRLVKYKFGFSRRVGALFSCLIIFLMTQYVPSSAETFYWFNGGVSYTLLLGLSLILLSFVYSLQYRETVTYSQLTGMTILALVIAGGHYPVTFPTLCLLGAFILDIAINKSLQKKIRIGAVIVCTVYLMGFLVTVIAPGNYLRMDSSETNSVVKTLLASIYGSAALIEQFITPEVIIGGVITCIITITASKPNKEKLNCPLFVTFISFCIMMASYIPGYFAKNIIVQMTEGRYKSLLFFYFCLLYSINIIVYTRWFYFKTILFVKKNITKEESGLKLSQNICIVTIGLVLISSLVFSGNFEWKQAWAFSVLESFDKGELQQFDYELDQRYKLLSDTEKRCAIIKPISVRPRVLYFSDISFEHEEWIIGALERYFDKEKIIVEKVY